MATGESDTTLRQAAVVLSHACRTLLANSTDAVDGLTSVLPLEQCDGEPEEWRRMAVMLAEAHHLDVQFAANETHLRIRFSRPADVPAHRGSPRG